MPLSYHLLPVRAFEDLFPQEDLRQFSILEWGVLLDSFHAMQTKRTGNPNQPLAQAYVDMAKQAHIQRWGHMGDEFLEYMNPGFWKRTTGTES